MDTLEHCTASDLHLTFGRSSHDTHLGSNYSKETHIPRYSKQRGTRAARCLASISAVLVVLVGLAACSSGSSSSESPAPTTTTPPVTTPPVTTPPVTTPPVTTPPVATPLTTTTVATTATTATIAPPLPLLYISAGNGSTGYSGRYPTTIYFSADSGNIVRQLSWSSWGPYTAVGSGTWDSLSCVPSCASSPAVPYRATITLSQPKSGEFTALQEVTSRFTSVDYLGRSGWPLFAS
jgi:hypothetical protein